MRMVCAWRRRRKILPLPRSVDEARAGGSVRFRAAITTRVPRRRVLVTGPWRIATRETWPPAAVRARGRLPQVACHCPTYQWNSHANRTRWSQRREDCDFKGQGGRLTCVRFPSPAPYPARAGDTSFDVRRDCQSSGAARSSLVANARKRLSFVHSRALSSAAYASRWTSTYPTHRPCSRFVSMNAKTSG